MNFDECFKMLMVHEGGSKYTNDPDDAGGETKFGISKRAFPNENIKEMTEERAKEICKKFYWDELGCDKLPEYLKYMALDCGFNQGANFSKECIKRVMEQYPLSESGQLIYFFNKRKARYLKNRQYTKFGKGWLSRLNKVNSICIKIQEKELGGIA